MSKFSSVQEAAVASLSKTVLGSQALFSPKNYGHPENEPADLVWISGRCAVIMYMTASRHRFDYKRSHNMKQMHRWLKHWEGGQHLQGTVRDNAVSYNFSDIDQIIGLSVVGGKHSGSMYEHCEMDGSNTKLMACATISDNVFRKLSSRVIGINDLIDFFDILESHPNERISDQRGIDIVDAWTGGLAALVRTNVEGHVDLTELDISWKQIRLSLFESSKQDKLPDTNDVIADLNLFDALWFNVAENYATKIRNKLPPNARKGYVIKQFSEPYNLVHINTEISPLNQEVLGDLAGCDIGFIHFDLGGNLGFMRMMTFGPTERPKRYIRKLAAHRSRVLATIERGDHMKPLQRQSKRQPS